MKITITKAQAEKIGMKALVPFTGEKDSWGYRGERELNLVPMTDARLNTLEQLGLIVRVARVKLASQRDTQLWRQTQALLKVHKLALKVKRTNEKGLTRRRR